MSDKPDVCTSPDEVLDLRELADGCIACGMSVVYCHAVRDFERRPCCIICDHLGA